LVLTGASEFSISVFYATTDRKMEIKFSSFFSFQFGHEKTWIRIQIHIDLKCWIRIEINTYGSETLDLTFKCNFYTWIRI